MNYYIPKKSWVKNLTEQIKKIDYNGIVFFDVDGIIFNNNLIILDFIESYNWIKKYRNDLFVGCLTHRKNIPQLKNVDFDIEITIDKIIEIVPDGNKVEYLNKIFNDCLHKILLVDDSLQGKRAEELGFGFYVQN